MNTQTTIERLLLRSMECKRAADMLRDKNDHETAQRMEQAALDLRSLCRAHALHNLPFASHD